MYFIHRPFFLEVSLLPEMRTMVDLVVMQSQDVGRIAQALGICNGQTVEFGSPGVSLNALVTVRDGGQSDLLLHVLMELFPGNCSIEAYSRSERLYLLDDGKMIETAKQNMWAGMRIVTPNSGTALLHVDGGSRNNPKGLTGYGFRITVGPNNNEAEWCEAMDTAV